MGLHYLTFMGRNFIIRKKLTLVQLMTTANVNIMNIMNNVGIIINNIFQRITMG